MGDLEMEFQQTKGHYAFTFTIPPFKNVYYKSNKRQYGKMPQNMQYDFLENHIQKCSSLLKNCQWVYEEHEDKRLHIHGFVKDTHWAEMEEFRARFYEYPISMSYKSYDKMSKLEKTIVNISYWESYIEKNQSKIKYYMRVIEDKKHASNLDGNKDFKLIIEERTYSPSFLNSLDEIQENDEDLGYTYPFGKKKNFLIEF